MLCALPLCAGAGEFGGKAALEARHFYESAEFGDGYSAALTLNFNQALPGAKTQLAGELFARRDSADRERSHADVRELFYEVIGEDYELRLGNRRVFWGVTEGRHLVDVINQSDFVEDLSNDSKLGQPMLSYNAIGAFGSAEFFLMPYQRERTYPGPRGHPRLPFPVAEDEARYESARGRHHLDTALRYRNSFGALDLGIAWFDGTAREPDILPCLRRGSGFQGTEERANCDLFAAAAAEAPQSPFPEELTPFLQALGLAPSDEEVAAEITQRVLDNLVLVPAYPRLRQLSLDALWVLDAWALKLEALRRERSGRASTAAVVGFEYTLGDVLGRGWDLGLIAEYLYDQRVDLVSSRYDHDWFLGTRLGFNDVAGTQILAGGIVDRSGDESAWQIEASGRLSDDFKLLGKWRGFSGRSGNPYLDFLEDEDLLQLTLEWYF